LLDYGQHGHSNIAGAMTEIGILKSRFL